MASVGAQRNIIIIETRVARLKYNSSVAIGTLCVNARIIALLSRVSISACRAICMAGTPRMCIAYQPWQTFARHNSDMAYRKRQKSVNQLAAASARISNSKRTIIDNGISMATRAARGAYHREKYRVPSLVSMAAKLGVAHHQRQSAFSDAYQRGETAATKNQSK